MLRVEQPMHIVIKLAIHCVKVVRVHRLSELAQSLEQLPQSTTPS